MSPNPPPNLSQTTEAGYTRMLVFERNGDKLKPVRRLVGKVNGKFSTTRLTEIGWGQLSRISGSDEEWAESKARTPVYAQTRGTLHKAGLVAYPGDKWPCLEMTQADREVARKVMEGLGDNKFAIVNEDDADTDLGFSATTEGESYAD